jgi:CheY-like chemotaxis protein
VFLITYVRDISEAKAAEESRNRVHMAEAQNQAKSRFLAHMSHEIRTPISAVMGISEIQLKTPSLDNTTKESLSQIYNSANLLLGIINDILDFSKIEVGKLEIIDDMYEVASFVHDIANLYFVYMNDKEIKFSVQIDPGLPAYLIGDVLRIKQIANNLISNAFKYTEKGVVEISVKWNDPYLELSVCDTGLGMTEAQLNNLFVEYERFHEREAVTATGTGLGMAIVYNLLRLMNGEHKITSEPRKGTDIHIKIAQKAATSEILGQETATRLERFDDYNHDMVNLTSFIPESMPYGKVLVVDDVSANLYVAKGLLAFYDLIVETCDSGMEAIEKIEAENTYDIIFMDYMMPAMDGIETMQALRKLGYSRPIIALTANAIIGQAEKFLKAGFTDYLSKPIQTKRLDEILVQYIKDTQPPEVIENAKNAKKQTQNINSYLQDETLQATLRENFATEQQDVYEKITAALKSNDLKTAHFLIHTLKGAAALIAATALVTISEAIEFNLDKNKPPSLTQLATLQTELAQALASIPSTQSTNAIYDTLIPLLESRSPSAINHLNDIRNIPQAAVLIHQIENLNFPDSLKTIKVLKKLK